MHQRDICHSWEEQQVARTLPFSKEAFQTLFFESLDAILVIDAERGDILDANPATQRLFGYDHEALRGKHFTAITPSDRDQSQAEFLRDASNYQAVSRVQRIRRTDGSICPVEVSATMLPWEKGPAIFATLRDVSERAQAEQRSREVNRALRTLSAYNQVVIRAGDEQELLNGVCRVIVEIGGYRFAWIGYAQQDENKSVRPIAQAGFDDGYLDTLNVTWADNERGRGPTGTAIRTREPATARDISTDPGFAPWREQAIARGYAASIALPLCIDGRVCGALNVYAAEPDAFDPVEVELLTELVDDLAYGVSALRTRAEHQEAAEALQESQRRLSHLMAHLPGMAYRCRNDPDWTMEFVSEGCFDLTGYPSTDLIGGRKIAYSELIHPDDRGFVWLEVQTALEEKEPFRLTYRIKTADGREKRVWEQGSGIFSPGNELIALEGLILDITERVQAEQATERHNSELEMLNSVISTAASTLDEQQVLQVACRELAHTFGLPQAAAALLNAEGTEATVVAEYLAPGRPLGLGKTIPVAGNPATEYVLEHREPLAITDAQTDERTAAVRSLMRERETASLLIVPIPVARGRIAGTIGLDAIERHEFSQEEITLARSVAAAAGQALETARLHQALRRNVERLEETVAQRTIELREALERAKDADRVKSEFVSNVSHELRGPLTNLKLYLGLLSRGRPQKRDKYMDVLHRETDRLQDLIEGLLDISRLDLDKTQAYLQPIDVNLLVGTLASDRYALVNERGLMLEVEPTEGLPQVMADAKLLEQVLTNLLTNAVNYTPAGGRIKLSSGLAEEEGDDWVTASISDTGPGISEEDQKHLFERFYRGAAGRSSDAPGTGLGLAICREIMARHNGKITLRSKIGEGSTFTIWLRIHGGAPDRAPRVGSS